MKEHVKLRKQGKFYSAFENDAYIVHAIMGYKLSNGRVGFPVDSLGRVTNELDNHKVSYVVIENDKETIKQKYPSGNYYKYLKEGEKSFKKIKDEEDLIEVIRHLSKEKLEKIVDFIKEVANEE